MATTDYDIAGVDLHDDRYTVEQSLVRNKYKATDSSGNVVLRGKQETFKLKEEFPFEDGDGNDVFSVQAGGVIDVAGDYTIVDAQTGEEVVVLDNRWAWTTDHWKLRDPDTEAVIAEIRTKNRIVEVLRNVHGIFHFVPHKYEITAPDGAHVGDIDGAFSMKDRYEITIDGASEVPREAVLAAAMVIDAIEGN